MLPNETALAMVLAHELGHHQKRHCLKRLGRGLLWTIVTSGLFGSSAEGAVGRSLNLAQLSFSRDQEREADAFGIQLVFDTYGHTEGCTEFFEIINTEYETNTQRWVTLFTTHPYTPDRLNFLKQRQLELQSENKNIPVTRNQ